MKTIVKKILGVGGAAVVILAANAHAEGERASVSLELPSDFIVKACPAAVWKGSKLQWKGVVDARTQPEVGGQSKKKGKDPVLVDAAPPLTEVLNDALPTLFQSCGMKLVDADTSLPATRRSLRLVEEGRPDVTLSAEIKEFYAGVEKGLFTGKGMARSALLFHVTKKNDTTERTVEVGYEMESKKIRQKDIRQLESTLNELLARTLEQVPKLDGFKDF
ncbi:MAG TPA: YajG family lipoprotein [bacterium]|nr:YajG family lipoprotein [bacterium]